MGLGLALWLGCLIVIVATGTLTLVPSLILIGSFVVPVSFVVWAFESWRDEDVTTELIVTAFVVGGLLGALGASVLEAYLLRPSPWLFVGVGLIEEGAKLGALLMVTRRMTRRHARDGVVLGAAVGFGFAAFETAGYAFTVLVAEGGSFQALVQTQVLRGLLAPFGHGLWTAIVGGVVFSRLARGRTAWGPAAVVAYLWVSLLHALWDSMQQLATVAVLLLTATGAQERLLEQGRLPSLSAVQEQLITGVRYGGFALVAVAGLVTLGVLRARYGTGSRATGRPGASGEAVGRP